MVTFVLLWDRKIDSCQPRFPSLERAHFLSVGECLWPSTQERRSSTSYFTAFGTWQWSITEPTAERNLHRWVSSKIRLHSSKSVCWSRPIHFVWYPNSGRGLSADERTMDISFERSWRSTIHQRHVMHRTPAPLMTFFWDWRQEINNPEIPRTQQHHSHLTRS